MESDHQGIFIPVKRKRNPNLKFSPKQQVSKKRKRYFVARCPSVVFAKMNGKRVSNLIKNVNFRNYTRTYLFTFLES